MKAQFDDRAKDIGWEQPEPLRQHGHTFVMLRFDSNLGLVMELNLTDLADALREALDPQAAEDLVDLLDARVPPVNVAAALTDLRLLYLEEQAGELASTVQLARDQRGQQKNLLAGRDVNGDSA